MPDASATAALPTGQTLFVCPNCGSGQLESEFDGEFTNFRCRACGACWHWELNYISRVSPPRATTPEPGPPVPDVTRSELYLG